MDSKRNIQKRRTKCQSYTKNGISYIKLTQGYWAQCSPKDLQYLLQWVWYENIKSNYVSTMAYDKKSGKKITMSRLIAKRIFGSIPKGKEVDHKDTNPLNNQKLNLRMAKHFQNLQNQNIRKMEKSSKYKGVCFDNTRKNWKAQIIKNGKSISNKFPTEIEAALWYNQKASEIFGEFARLNEIL